MEGKRSWLTSYVDFLQRYRWLMLGFWLVCLVLGLIFVSRPLACPRLSNSRLPLPLQLLLIACCAIVMRHPSAGPKTAGHHVAFPCPSTWQQGRDCASKGALHYLTHIITPSWLPLSQRGACSTSLLVSLTACTPERAGCRLSKHLATLAHHCAAGAAQSVRYYPWQ